MGLRILGEFTGRQFNVWTGSTVSSVLVVKAENGQRYLQFIRIARPQTTVPYYPRSCELHVLYTLRTEEIKAETHTAEIIQFPKK